ncbi:MAG: hypothetical protein N3A54_01200 [Patescibacteria group bacterium]|nr:hypothetical protein [Patescibacteria group bacterium]
MSVLLQFSPGLVKKQQIFTSSGTFTPSARLLELGGWVEVICVGGGGGGFDDGSGPRHGGGAGSFVRAIVQVTGAVTVTIGAGGTGGSSPTFGGNTTFGSLVTGAGGHAANQWAGGSSDWYTYALGPGGAGPAGQSEIFYTGYTYVGFGCNATEGYCVGGAGVTNYNYFTLFPANAPANTGNGGIAGGNGGSGICIVEWWE